MGIALAALQQVQPTMMSTQVLVLTPTREIAFQIESLCSRMGTGSGINILVVVGQPTAPPPESTNAHIVIGIPRMRLLCVSVFINITNHKMQSTWKKWSHVRQYARIP